MITTLVGKTFLQAYNREYKKEYSAKDFFIDVFQPTFFNHEKYLMTGGNSSFENPKISWDKMYKGIIPFESADKRADRMLKFLEKSENANGVVDASIAMGYPASEVKDYASTSGLVSDVAIETNEEDVYLSWIGSGLGIGVSGGFSILINDEQIALETFEGWKHYRKYLNDPTLSKLRGNQINSWNGQWLTYKLGNNYRADFDFTTLSNEGIFKVDTNLVEVNTVNWSNLFFSLSKLYPNEVLNAYIYSFGQTNKTIGFIPIYLKSGTRLKNVFKHLFHSDKAFNNREFQSLFGMHIKRACELGNIGLHALRPENITKYMEDSKNLSFKKEKEETINYQSYKTWLVAMLSKNKEEITDYTAELAKLIQRYRAGAKGTDRKNLIEKDLFGAKSKKGFLDALTIMVNGIEKSDLEILKELRDEVHLMTNEEFGYFNTLLKFDYAFLEKHS